MNMELAFYMLILTLWVLLIMFCICYKIMRG